MNMIYTKTYGAPPIVEREILRYAGVREEPAEIVSLMREAVGEARDILTYKVCWGEFTVTGSGDTIDFGFADVQSKELAKNLEGCGRAIVFAATVGMGLDRLIRRYGVQSPSKALMMQAFGAERIEALCDRFVRDISQSQTVEEVRLTPRFSPGYGDLPLGFQEDIFRVLDCPRKIGLTLNESLLMSPSKSVTAIVGIKNERQ